MNNTLKTISFSIFALFFVFSTAHAQPKIAKSNGFPEVGEIIETTKKVFISFSGFLDNQKEKAEDKQKDLQNKLIGGLLGGENKNFLQIHLLALSAVIFSLDYKIIIYFFCIYFTYRILKFFAKKLFFRRNEDGY